jgi:hypothetical protein
MINYLNDIMSWVINQYKSCPITTNTNCIDNNLDNIHPCTTRPLDLEEKTFTKLFQMTFINWWIYAIDTYVTKQMLMCQK